MKRPLVIAAMVLPLLVGAPVVSGQDEAAAAVEAGGFIAQDDLPPLTKKQVARAKKQQEQRLKMRLSLRIRELKQTCNLSKAQVRRLELASKGAVSKYLEGFEGKLKKMRQQMMGDFVGAEIGLVEAVAEVGKSLLGKLSAKEKKNAEAAEVEAFRRELKAMFGGPFGAALSDDLEKQKFWRSAVEKTLTDEQRQRYEKHKAARKTYRRKSMVSQVVMQLDSRMLLTETERTKLQTAVDRELGRFLEVVEPGEQTSYVVGYMSMLNSTRSAFTKLKSRCRDFLGEDQLKHISRNPEEEFQQWGFLWGEPGFGLALPVEAEAVEEIIEQPAKVPEA